MRHALVRRLATLASVVFAAILISTQPAPVAAQVTSGSWGTSDGGAVSVKPGGACEVVFTDTSNGQSVYASGRIVNRQTTSDGKTEMTCRPAAGGASYVIVIGPDGNGELYVSEGGARHKATDLSK
jgi:hypothetical protein